MIRLEFRIIYSMIKLITCLKEYIITSIGFDKYSNLIPITNLLTVLQASISTTSLELFDYFIRYSKISKLILSILKTIKRSLRDNL